ncbi:hypothetical protein BJX99DRAFT_235402 [Aspergillus californicus]
MGSHTPFEISCCWKSEQQQGRPIIRYVYRCSSVNFGSNSDGCIQRGPQCSGDS